jgi:hypothetical protein
MRFAGGGTGAPKGDARRAAALTLAVRCEARRIFSVSPRIFRVSPELTDDPQGSTHPVKWLASLLRAPAGQEKCAASCPSELASDEKCLASHPP